MSYIIVGLGNPGVEYEQTRHNTGRLAVEFFVKKNKDDFSPWQTDKKLASQKSEGRIEGEKVVCLLPDGFMNNSGKSVKSLITSKKAAEKLIVIHDDLDLPLGQVKLGFGRGSGGHRGVDSIIKNIKTKDFVRFRIGISPATSSGKARKPSDEEKVIKHILGKFKSAELDTLKKINKKIAEAIEVLIERGRETAMSQFN